LLTTNRNILMKQNNQLARLCAILLAGLTSAQGAISVGPTGTGVLTFDATPVAADWSTASAAGGATGFGTALDMDTDIIGITEATTITTTLPTSGTVPPSANALARRNTTGNYLQTPPTGNAYTILMATLQNDTGGTKAFLNVSYDLNVLNTPNEQIPGWRVFWSMTGAAGTWQPIPSLSGALPAGRVSASIQLDSWAVGGTVYLLWGDDNADGGTEGLYTLDNFEATATAGRDPALTAFLGTATQFSARFLDGIPTSLTIKTSTVTATLDSTAIPASNVTVSSADGFVTIQATYPALAVSTGHIAVINFTDNATVAKAYSITQNFNVGPFQVIPAALAVTGVDTGSNGFKAFIHQLAGPRLAPDGTVGGTFDQNTIPAAERQLANHYLDPNTGVISVNHAIPNAEAMDGLYPFPVINWNQGAPVPPAAETGNFHVGSVPPNEDAPIPGLSLTPDYIVSEIFAFVELKAGRLYRMGVNSDDGFRVTVGPNARDVFVMTLGSFNGGRGAADTLFDFMVEADGFYPMRLLWFEGSGGANVEWFTVNDIGEKVLLNDQSVATHVKTYAAGPAFPPYVKAVWPPAGTTNAPGNFVLQIDLSDGATTVQTGTIRLWVNNVDVTSSATINKPVGSADTSVTFDPPGTLAPETELAVRLIYGDSAAVSRTNDFTIEVHPRLLFDVNATQIWSYNDLGADLGIAWRARNYNDALWLTGPAVIGFDTPTVEPVRTAANRYKEDGITQVTTFYFRTHFNFTGGPAGVNLFLRHVIDDGAVFYLNGEEIHRFGLAAGAVYDASTFFADNENAWRGPFSVPKSALVTGDNVLAVEVHQTSATSSDMIMGAQLFAVVDPTVGPAHVASFTPLANSTNHPAASPIVFLLEDGTTVVNPATIQLTVNGSVVTPVVNKPAGGILTTVSYLPVGGFAHDTAYTAKIQFNDDATPAATVIQEFSFRTALQSLVDFTANTLWRYDRSAADLGTAWRERVYDDALWPQGAPLIADETGAMPIPIRTPISRFNDEGTHVTTLYFRTHFDFTGNPAAARLFLRHVIDDGAVFYLNGQEIYRLGVPLGQNYQTFATGHEGALEGPFLVPNSALRVGDNVIAVEVHQPDTTSSDVVFGAELTVGVNPDVGPARVASATPAAGSVNQSDTSPIVIVLEDGLTQVAPASIKLTVNGTQETPAVTKPEGGIMTTVAYTSAVPYIAESIVNVKLEFNDNGNPVNSTVHQFSFQVYPGLQTLFNVLTQSWRYSNEGLDLGTAWREKNYVDTAWPEGLPLFLASETGATIEVAQTPALSRFGPDGTTPVITDYFRTHFNFAGDPATTRLALRYIVDDGAVVYLNGQEVHRFYMAAGPVTAATLAGEGFTPTDHEGRDHYDGPFIIPGSGLVVGDNVIAVEVHQNSATSSDMVFGLELSRVTSTAPISTETRFSSITLENGSIRIEWTGPGMLQATPDFGTAWTNLPTATSPYIAPATGASKFYRIIQ